jgi:hypothetical protein
MGIVFFGLMLLDSHIERRIATPISLGVPRWNKRVSYYIFKIRYLQYTNRKLMRIPNYSINSLITNKYFNEYESYE